MALEMVRDGQLKEKNKAQRRETRHVSVLGGLFNRVLSKCLLKRVSHAHICEKRIPSRGNSMCKCHEAAVLDVFKELHGT